MQQDDLDRGKKCLLGRRRFPPQPAADVLVRDFKMPGELVDAAQHEAGPMERAGMDARMLRRGERAVFRGGGRLSHKRYRATLSAHTQVAIIERIVSLFGRRRVA